MQVYFDPTTGVVERREMPPSSAWTRVEGTTTLLRTREPSGLWAAERVHSNRAGEYVDVGWEKVVRKRVPIPEAWLVGAKSGVRFGFAPPPRAEQEPEAPTPKIAVVLPDEPGLVAAENCPGSRYLFEIGMLTEGAPADYLVEKLLTFRARRFGLRPVSPAWMFDPGRPPSPWQEERLEELRALATLLSDDLTAAARATFGEGQAYVSWSRRKQWRVQKAQMTGKSADVR